MNRQAVVRILKEVGLMLEIQGESPFRIRAYENAARAIEGAAEEPDELLETGRLAELRGVGPGLVAAVGEIVQTGRLALREQLRAAVPAGLLELLRVEGLGAKKARLLYQKLGIASLADLEAACREGRVAALPGFGDKSQAKLLDGIDHLRKYAERHLVSDARPVAERCLTELRRLPGVQGAEIAGSLRRQRETIGDLDLVAAVAMADRADVARDFAVALGAQIVASGETKVTLALVGGLQVDLRMVLPEQLASAWHHFTGSKEHNILLRSRAKSEGLTLNEYGLFRDGQPLAVPSEEALYAALGLAWIPPELREGRDELERAEHRTLPVLVAGRDLRGTLHIHTSWSDGTASLGRMAEATASRGWSYLGIADHSRAAAYAGGMAPERVLEQWSEIEEWNRSHPELRLLKGIECDILADGTLDYDDELLLGFDFVVASVHSRFGLPAEQMTARIARAVSHPCTTFLGHPTGRLLLARDGYSLNLDAVLDAALAHGVIVEINASPHRLDLDWRPLTGWLARGGITSVHPDAHSVAGLADVDYGIGVARKAGAEARQVFNTWELATVVDYLEARRSRARALLSIPGG